MGHRATKKTQRHHHLALHPPPASRFRSREEIETPPSHHRTWRCVCVCCHHGSLPNSHFCSHVQSMCVCMCVCARAYVCVCVWAGGRAGGRAGTCVRVFVYVIQCVCMPCEYERACSHNCQIYTNGRTHEAKRYTKIYSYMHSECARRFTEYA